MRTPAQEHEHHVQRRENGGYKRRGPKKRYTPTTEAVEQPWPAVFQNGRPLPSDLSVDSVITIFDGDGHMTQFVDPTTRIVIEATAPYRRIGLRRDPDAKERDEAIDEVALEV